MDSNNSSLITIDASHNVKFFQIKEERSHTKVCKQNHKSNSTNIKHS